MNYQEDKRLIEETLIGSKLLTEVNHIDSIGHGKNNRTYSVSGKGKKYFAKFYYFSESDNRNRLDSEFKFLYYANKKNLTCVPEAILRLDAKNLGIYEFIEGEKFIVDDLNQEKIISAANFFRSLNTPGDDISAKNINSASEAFLDLDEYMSMIDKKIFILKEVASSSSDDSLTGYLKELQKIWQNTKAKLTKDYDFLSKNQSLCVSPSDFGFHNALKTTKGLYFLDFEYAGLDDPAKFISDFFIQPEIRVPFKYFEEFSYIALDGFSDQNLLFERVKKLFPMFQIKWCCIILNEFIPSVAGRRIFSNPDIDIEKSKKNQLKKAQALLSEIN